MAAAYYKEENKMTHGKQTTSPFSYHSHSQSSEDSSNPQPLDGVVGPLELQLQLELLLELGWSWSWAGIQPLHGEVGPLELQLQLK